MLKGRRVLVVEDEAVTALDVGDAVEAAGGTVVGPTPSTRGALKLLKDAPDGVDGREYYRPTDRGVERDLGQRLERLRAVLRDRPHG